MSIRDLLRSHVRQSPKQPSQNAVYCGNYRVLTRLQSGHKMFVDSRDVSLAPHLIMDGDWEAWIAAEVRQHLRPGMRVVEVGANVGFYSLLMAQAIWPTGKLVTFEANADLAELVQHNLGINGLGLQSGLSKVVASAVADTPGTRTFHRCKNYMGSSSLFDIDPVFGETSEKIDVPCTTLDIALADFGPVDFIKIDAESAEYWIFKGAAETINRSPSLKMVIEFQPQRQLYDLLKGHGFAISPILPGQKVVPRSFEEIERNGTCDVLVSRA